MLCRTPRECVDWNKRKDGTQSNRLCRTPRECVDWNKKRAAAISRVVKSHSSWVRGLKPLIDTVSGLFTSRTPRECVDWNYNIDHYAVCGYVALLVSAWIETVKICTLFVLFVVALLVSAWIETCRILWNWEYPGMSHSSWVRGLKHERTKRGVYEMSRTPRECVDWNFSGEENNFIRIRRTPRECVDWNSSLKGLRSAILSRTPRECVDWNSSCLAW